MPSVGLAEVTMVVGYLAMLGLIVGLPIWAIGLIRRNRDRIRDLERRVDELEGGSGPSRS
jgi:hypothetical protein